MRTFDFALDRPKPKPYIRVVWDLETTLIAPMVQAPNVVALGFRVGGGARHVVMANDPRFESVVELLFSNPDFLLFGHNVRFDVAVLMAHGARIGKAVEWAQMILGALHDDRVTCTLIREALIRIALANPMKGHLGYDLGTCAKEWRTPTQPNKEDPWRVRWGTLAHLHVSQLPPDARRYLDEDLDATDELFLAQEAKRPWLKDQYRQTRASVALQLMTCWGLRTDRRAAEELLRLTKHELAQAEAVAKAAGLVREDGSRNKLAAEARMVQVFEARGEACPRGEPTPKMVAKWVADQRAAGRPEDEINPDHCPGNVKLDDESCEKSRDPALIAYSKVSQANTLLGKVERVLNPVIQASYVTLMATGRTSCRQGDDPAPGEAPKAYGSQIQNPPRDVTITCPECGGKKCSACGNKGEISVPGIRECFVAREGTVFGDVDYAAMELRTLAEVEFRWFGTSTLGAILNDPKRCPHVELGAALLGIPVDEAYALKKTDPKKFKLLRNLAKGFNFGTPGGMGWERLIEYCWKGYKVTISPEEAKHYCKMVKEMYPERPKYLQVASDRVREAPGGRARIVCEYSERVRGGVGFCDGANNPFQALASDCAKEALWRLCVHYYAVPESLLFGCRGVAFIHDQTITELLEDRYAARAKLLGEIWVGAAQDICSHVLIQAEPAVCRRWSKEAGDPVYWPDGTLAIYEDWKAAQTKKAA